MAITVAHNPPAYIIGGLGALAGKSQRMAQVQDREDAQANQRTMMMQQAALQDAARRQQQQYESDMMQQRASLSAEEDQRRYLQDLARLDYQHGIKADDEAQDYIRKLSMYRLPEPPKGYDYTPEQRQEMSRISGAMNQLMTNPSWSTAQKENGLRQLAGRLRNIVPTKVPDRELPSPREQFDSSTIKLKSGAIIAMDENGKFYTVQKASDTPSMSELASVWKVAHESMKTINAKGEEVLPDPQAVAGRVREILASYSAGEDARAAKSGIIPGIQPGADGMQFAPTSQAAPKQAPIPLGAASPIQTSMGDVDAMSGAMRPPYPTNTPDPIVAQMEQQIQRRMVDDSVDPNAESLRMFPSQETSGREFSNRLNQEINMAYNFRPTVSREDVMDKISALPESTQRDIESEMRRIKELAKTDKTNAMFYFQQLINKIAAIKGPVARNPQ